MKQHPPMESFTLMIKRFQVKILYAGWIRDGTWPPDAQAPGSDGDLVQDH